MLNQLFRSTGLVAFSILNNQLRNISRNFSICSPKIHNIRSNDTLNWFIRPILQPNAVTIIAQRGMKQVGNCKRRCKDCYFVVRQERLYVMCKTHPRHKQMAMKKRQKNTWILTDATQSVKRAW